MPAIQSGAAPCAAFCNAAKVCMIARVWIESLFKTSNERPSADSSLLVITPSSSRSCSSATPSSVLVIGLSSIRFSAAPRLSLISSVSVSCCSTPILILLDSSPVTSTRLRVTNTKSGMNRISRNVLFLKAVARSLRASMRTLFIIMNTTRRESRIENTHRGRRRRSIYSYATPLFASPGFLFLRVYGR